MSYSAFGIKLQIFDEDTFKDLAEILDFDGASLSKETNEVTSHNQNDKWRRFISSLRDGGEISFDVNFAPERDKFKIDKSKIDLFRIIFPDDDNTQWRLEGTMTGLNPSNPVEGVMTASITIKVTGKPLFDANIPVADFEADKVVADVGEDIQFTDLSTNDPAEWFWDFGDGNTSTEENPVHSYSEDGSYTVKLTVTNDDGIDSIEKENYITIN